MTESSIPSQLRELYARAMLRADPTDWPQLEGRAKAAAELGRRAFAERDRTAWEIVQAVEWRLHRASALRPNDPGDVLVLDALYRAEEATLPDEKPPAGLDPKSFCELLARTIAEHSSADGKLIGLMKDGNLSVEDWQFFGYQWVPAAIDFTRQIALCSLTLPRESAKFLYLNLYDEIGKGNPEFAHWNLLTKFLGPLGVRFDDESSILAWAAPEVLAMVNTQNRLIWHREPGWALGSMFLAERLVPSELDQVRKAALGIDLPKGSLDFFEDHVETDVGHAEDWLTIIRGMLETYEQQCVVHAAALQRGRVQRRAWDGAFEAWQVWKKTGVAPHVRFEELEGAARP
ncbi:iron-containing redox enzyme family protein [Pendulispora albinea]|uniref:Iron-containing redox enzyme family protein n=1 Tax=Pendulispora albinea TaxID=2741071 RepID=A0ABZ2LX12_9BACT